ncbi:nucleoside triphosphate pyrophosphatase [Psychromonas sp. 14N.309.X.WAT.B.A12]|jgi:septum formation protein|uniref:Maf family protein n=1 Tax=unclassified Psychromonas TaxID=2614957 RepID=UPI0025B1F455|nr:Maf family protein [Psychromonas sp. 14N.309.X.WAT.B.A12]MDN2663688.1 Maf family protein [Psychromonas sp. 14N.309.X.WAT.B.A12]
MPFKLFLASGSPRRGELLSQINVEYQRIKAGIDETQQVAESAEHYVQRLALEKALAGLLNNQQQGVVLGADTIVVCDGIVMEKPQDKLHAQQMMHLLSGNTHQVLTAVALVTAQQQAVKLVTTDVTFKILSDQEISDYWDTGEPKDKAGGYGIQGIAGQFVTHISGSYSAVVGLPLYETAQLIKRFEEA